jgi:hypothetical protein
MSDLKKAAQQFVADYENGDLGDLKHYARALRAALAQQQEQSDINWLKARPHVEDFIDHLGYDMTITNERVRFDAREKVDVLAQQEPRNQCGETCERAKLCAVCARGLEQEPEQEQEPVAWMRNDGLKAMPADEKTAWAEADLCHLISDYTIPLYTHPPRREWQGLTEEEIVMEYVKWDATPGASMADFARAVEQALKERNT